MFNELSINEWKVNGAWINPVIINLSSSDIDNIFSQLQDGVQDGKINNTVKKLQYKILELEKIIKDELSPRERWYHRATGLPEPYPKGCRWKSFIEVWKKVAAKFNDKVDVEGYRLKTHKEFEVYGLLGLERLRKLPPLREPYK